MSVSLDTLNAELKYHQEKKKNQYLESELTKADAIIETIKNFAEQLSER